MSNQKENKTESGDHERVKGYHLPPAKLNWRGRLYAAIYTLGPVLLALIAIDILFWIFFSVYLNRCYGVTCFF